MRFAYMAFLHVGLSEKPCFMRAGMGSSHDLDPTNTQLKELDINEAAALAVLLGRGDSDYCRRLRAYFVTVEEDKKVVVHKDLSEAELLGCFPGATPLLSSKKLIALVKQLIKEPDA